jgi:flagellar assembly factor FliW
MKRDHLRFVLDNWLLKNIAFRGISRMEYIIAAIPLTETTSNDVDIGEFYKEFKDHRDSIDTKFSRSLMVENETQMLVTEIKTIQRKLEKKLIN